MNDYPSSPDPFSNPLDALLVDMAIAVQLPPGLHAKACERYAAVQRYLNRPGSPLQGRVLQFYPQGSMAIDATTSTRGTDDEYDVDGVAELDLPPGMPPIQVHNLLWEALKDYPVDKVSRQTRCVTLHYSDGMHIDVTPSRRSPNTPELESVIFHAKEGTPRLEHAEIPMNAKGFANWYNERTPSEDRFSDAYNARLYEAIELLAKADTVVHDVPDQVPLPHKSVTTVALQLIKRFRNVWMLNRAGRYPPSVMLSCHAGYAALPGIRLSEMVVRQARWTATAIDRAAREGRLIDVRNPVMRSDCFTDRWPTTQAQQQEFAGALRELAEGIEALRSGTHDVQLEDMKDWLRERFGERVVSRSFVAFNAHQGAVLRGGLHGYTSKGGLFIPTAPAIIAARPASASVVAPRRHTNMGEKR